MQLPSTYDDSNHVADQSFDPLPPGKYSVMIAAAEIEPTRDNTSSMLKLELQVLDGQHHAGRMIFDRLMLQSSRTDEKMNKALRIAAGRIHSIRTALGMAAFNDTDQIVGRSLSVTVKVSPAKGDYGPSNDVTAYEPLAGAAAPPTTSAPPPAAPATQPQPAQPQPAAAGAGGGSAPWARPA